MAKCTLGQYERFTVTLDGTEMETVEQHGKRENLMLTDAMADLVEYVIAQKRCEICQEENEAIACQSEEARTIGLNIKYPKKGPLSLLTDSEKDYLLSRLMEALGKGVTGLLIRHSSGGN